ncbi:MAG: 5-(carboxyamino)imidazole ribonucleotide synthase [Ferruginibacter sp.]|nr:5-(carboxyamino)imidazole ribonucleotide synthase [Cytophagales bacterium]
MNALDANFKLGLLGGGQLGRMLIQSAIDFNLHVSVLDADAVAPCRPLAHAFTLGSPTDFEAVYRFGQTVDMLTIEIENVNVEALERLQGEGKPVFPQPAVIRIIQDKRVQKQFYRDHGLPTADFVLTNDRQEVRQHTRFLPAFHKLGRAGYDGHGVQHLRSTADLDRAFDAPGVLEKAVDFDREISVIVARNGRGEVASFPTVELVFHPEHHLVEYLFAPSFLPVGLQQRAEALAVRTAEHLGIVGLLAVEMFVTKTGELLVNEVAPRPHNSGHHTLRANYTSQFEQHLRAILHLPLGDPRAHTPAAMVNLLGEAGHHGEARYEGMEAILAMKGVYPHLYGKRFTKPFRKMGHVTILDADPESLKKKVEAVKNGLKVVSE